MYGPQVYVPLFVAYGQSCLVWGVTCGASIAHPCSIIHGCAVTRHGSAHLYVSVCWQVELVMETHIKFLEMYSKVNADEVVVGWCVFQMFSGVGQRQVESYSAPVSDLPLFGILPTAPAGMPLALNYGTHRHASMPPLRPTQKYVNRYTCWSTPPCVVIT
jgi:hypothetical protein